MKTKKTIRRLSPLARKAAYLAREAHGVQRRLDYLVEEIARVEMQSKAMEKALEACIADRESFRSRVASESILEQEVSMCSADEVQL